MGPGKKISRGSARPSSKTTPGDPHLVSAGSAPAMDGALPPTVDDILEATAESAIRFTRADQGHAYLVATEDDGTEVVTHQCLVLPEGGIVRQYERRRRLLEGPCQEAIREGRMYYVHDASTNRLHQDLLRALEARTREIRGDRLRLEYARQYLAFLKPARSYIAVPIKRPGGEAVGCVALYSTEREDFFGVLKKRIIEEYLDNFAGALIVALIEKARGAQLPTAPPRVFDDSEGSPWDGTGPYLERLLRHHLRRGSWNRALSEVERFMIELALRRSRGHPSQAFRLLRMPRRTFFAKLRKHGIDAAHYSPGESEGRR
ncbi:GAF domain-containing protein [bacterium]|nr:GAF domain-containing protein [bacterium]